MQKKKQAEVEVKGITKNYLMHYMYMSPECYKKIFGEEAQYNTLLAIEQNDIKNQKKWKIN